ncbi:MAG: metallophosphoesterase family protein [bacterium]
MQLSKGNGPRWGFAATLLLLSGLSGTSDAGIIKGPYLQALRTDGITILWQQQNATTGTVTINGSSLGSPSGTLHEVVVTGLSPDTTYTYTVDSDGETDSGTFTTAPSDPLACFAFLALGDNRSIHADHTTVVNAVLQNEAGMGFLMNTGDLVSSGEVGSDWQFFFDIEYPLIKDLPFYPTIGNHEEDGGSLPSFYTDHLAPPTDTSGTENYYSFVYANSAFIVLDGHVDIVPLIGNFSANQLSWLNAELAQHSADPTIQHIFVFSHEPPYSSADNRTGNYYLRELLRQASSAFAVHGVDAVICGHDHYIERGASPVGVRYYIMGGGGAPIYNNNSVGNLGSKPATIAGLFTDAHDVYFAQEIHGYMRVTVCNGQVDVEIKDTTNNVLDTESWNTGDILPPGPDAGVPDAGLPQSDAAPTQDDAAPTQGDAETSTPDSAAPQPDSGATPGTPDSGCSCRQSSGGAPGGAVVLLLLGLLWRRRRSSRPGAYLQSRSTQWSTTRDSHNGCGKRWRERREK